VYCKCVLRSLEVLRWNTYYKQAGTYVNLGCYILSKGHNGVLFSVFFGTVCVHTLRGVHPGTPGYTDAKSKMKKNWNTLMLDGHTSHTTTSKRMGDQGDFKCNRDHQRDPSRRISHSHVVDSLPNDIVFTAESLPTRVHTQRNLIDRYYGFYDTYMYAHEHIHIHVMYYMSCTTSSSTSTAGTRTRVEVTKLPGTLKKTIPVSCTRV